MYWLLKKLEENLQLKNYSKETIKGYLNHVKKYLEFSKDKGINQVSAKDFLILSLKTKEPTSVRHSVFAIKYFFKEILKQNLNIPNPKRNNKLPEILTAEEIKKKIYVTFNIKH